MAESARYESTQAKDVAKSTVKIQKVVVHYTGHDEQGSPKDFSVEFDAGKYGALVWQTKVKNEFLAGKTREEPPLPGELPTPKSSKSVAEQVAEAPVGTCCFINGRWVCWT